MTYIHFIVNPISGSGKHNISATMLRNHFSRDKFTIEVDYTKHKRHAIKLTENAVANKPNIIVACGGDGTINEVASGLVGTDIKLGIIPVGSGNGLASNLGIPREIEKAIAIIEKGNVSSIDVGTVNGHYFFSNMGIGIDAMIIKKYEQSSKRKLSAYLKAAMASSFKYKPQYANLAFDNNRRELKPFLLFISNSNEMGYNMSLTPKASLNDGLLDMVVVPALSFFEKLSLGLAVLQNKVEHFKKAEHFLIQNLHVEMPDKIFTDAQIDGEHHNLKTNKVEIGLISKGLKVITE